MTDMAGYEMNSRIYFCQGGSCGCVAPVFRFQIVMERRSCRSLPRGHSLTPSHPHIEESSSFLPFQRSLHRWGHVRWEESSAFRGCVQSVKLIDLSGRSRFCERGRQTSSAMVREHLQILRPRAALRKRFESLA